jgi:2-keto-4-pentenoate hydratase/2-oxohepta-3-ene-1,7-dioic acid hydratase in catechol pathway
MRIARWLDPAGQVGEGFVIDDLVVPFPDGATVADVLEAGLAAAHALRARAVSAGLDLGDVRLLAPLRPASIRDFVAFEEHVEGVTASIDGASDVVPEWYEAPTFYFTNPHTVLGPDESVAPPVCDRLDFELELAVVLGGAPDADGRNLSREESADRIFGYTIMNDWSARDIQAREMKVRLGPAKGKDFGTSLGPWIVTADELAPRLDADGFLALRAEVFVNDVQIGEDLVSNMGWPFPELIAYASRNSRVVAGDVLGSGTVGNGGCLAELWGRSGSLTPPPLREGDEVRMTIDGIGTLTGTVGAAVTAPPVAPARSRPRARH